jgi:magnesium transporter
MPGLTGVPYGYAPRMTAVSERQAETHAGELTLRLFHRDRVERLDGFDDVPTRLRNSALLWADLRRPSEGVVRQLAEHFELDERTAQSLQRPSPTPEFRDLGTFVHVTAYAPGADDRDEPDNVECVVGEKWVATSHDGPIPVLESFAELASGSGHTGELDGPRFLAALLEWVLNEYAMAFERLEVELEEIDRQAMRGDGRPEAVIEQLVDLRSRIGVLRRSLVAHRGALLALAHPELEALGDGDSGRLFSVLLDRYESTLQLARDARESVVNSFDVLIARTGQRTNEIVKVLTLASVIFLPGAVLAGIMGMNFKVSLFEHTIGFWLTVAAILFIGVLTLVGAKLRDWI